MDNFDVLLRAANILDTNKSVKVSGVLGKRSYSFIGQQTPRRPPSINHRNGSQSPTHSTVSGSSCADLSGDDMTVGGWDRGAGEETGESLTTSRYVKRDEGSRIVHNALEKTRRAKLRTKLDDLADLLPPAPPGLTRHTTLNMLNRTYNHLNVLHAKHTTLTEQLAESKQRTTLLKETLANLKHSSIKVTEETFVNVVDVEPISLPPQRPLLMSTPLLIGGESGIFRTPPLPPTTLANITKHIIAAQQ